MKILIFLVFLSVQYGFAFDCPTGVLVTAHGVSNHTMGSDPHGGHGNHPGGSMGAASPWDEAVKLLIAEAQKETETPIRLSFGMWDLKSFQKGIDELGILGVCRIKILPLFISTHSEVYQMQKYQFGKSDYRPLPIPGRIVYPASIQNPITDVLMYEALNDHEIVVSIIKDRIQDAVESLKNKAEIILVAHGPSLREEDDQNWLANMRAIVQQLGIKNKKIASITVATLRDDASAEIRDKKTAELRKRVQDITERSHEAVIIPLLLAPGGIQKRLVDRLQGLTYHLQSKALLFDPTECVATGNCDLRLKNWILEKARESQSLK